MHDQENQGIKEMPEVENSFTQFALEALPKPVWLVQKVVRADWVAVIVSEEI
tara:strand:- start:285 stop:440 length:156 start_codon:yes stop_codon:yes gene_type:complete